jgi:ATP-binding cassette subfamily F protein 3
MQTILSVQNLVFRYPTQDIFNDVSFNIFEGDRVAFVGSNGTGKTTLIKLILGKEEPTKGNIALARNINIGYLSQEVISSETNTLYEEAKLVFKDLMKLGEDLSRLEAKLAQEPSNNALIEEYGKKQNYFTLHNGYDYEYMIDMILSKFGFSKEDYSRPINSFSGGEKTKMSFAKLLLRKPELLVLDEPTNHLDLSTIEWLESYLKTYEGTLIFVSHDRYFINALATKIYEIDNEKLDYYKGNYDFYIKEKQIRYENQLQAYNNQQKEIEKMKRFIEFYMPKPRFVNRAKDRVHKLEHMKMIDKPDGPEREIKIMFKGDALEGKKIIGAEHLVIGYDKPLVNDVNFLVLGKDRLAIMGDNGTGKTTLLKYIMGSEKPLEGEIIRYRGLNIGYIDQHHFDIHGDKTITNWLLDEFPLMGEKGVYNHLGKFNFHDDDFFKTLDMLSGGEKMRLVLARIILKEYDLLLLDEPTNHLDLLTKQALIRALDNYEGTIIFVSHDRHFVDEIANKILYFTNKKSYFHEGSYKEFKELEANLFNLDNEVKEEPVKKETPVKRTHTGGSTSKLEEKIAKLEEKIKFWKEEEFKEENYTYPDKMKKLDEQIKKASEELELLTLEYLERNE